MSWEDDFIERYGEAAYEEKLTKRRAWHEEHINEVKARWKKVKDK